MKTEKVPLRIQPLHGTFFHECAVCDERKHCRHRDLDLQRGGSICDDCAPAVINAEHALRDARMSEPLDRALDTL